MNERIQQLWSQAEEEIAAEYEDESRRNRRLYNEIFMPKFAELIVRECMNTIDPKTGTKWIKDQTQEEFWKNQSVHLIKKHFGVEE